MSTTQPEDDRTMLVGPAVALGAAPHSVRENDQNALRAGDRVLEFEILHVIGIGGFGIVYLAHDHSLQRNIALKEYMPSSLAERTRSSQVAVKSERYAETFDAGMRSFINEARLLAQFDHPSLVKVYRFWEANGTAYMVMPFYEGLTLKQTLQARSEPPDEPWLKCVLAPLLDALETMHDEHCFHRDIAPDNILMLSDGRPLLLDFGAARRVISGLDQAFTVILKPGYAPIEQYADAVVMQQGAWTDIYALASVMHFAITGHPPVPSVTRMINDTQQPLAQSAAARYSTPFLRVLDRCLAVQPPDRPQSVVELRAQLQLKHHSSVSHVAPSIGSRSSVVPTPVDRVTQPAGAGKMVRYVMLGFIVVAAASAALFFTSRASAPASTNQVVASETRVRQDLLPLSDARARLPSVPPMAPAAESAGALIAPPTKPPNALAILDQIFAARNADQAVTVAVDKPKVRIGSDPLRMTVTSAKPGYVYLLMVGTNRADFTLLFPNATDKHNLITPSKPLSLPRKGWRLGAFGPPGVDQFVAIVSDMPRQFKDAGLKQGDLFGEFPQSVVEKAGMVPPGTAPAFAGKADCAHAPALPCVETYGAAQFSIEEVAVGKSP